MFIVQNYWPLFHGILMTLNMMLCLSSLRSYQSTYLLKFFLLSSYSFQMVLVHDLSNTTNKGLSKRLYANCPRGHYIIT